MSDRSYRRLTRYAGFAAVSVPSLLIAKLSPVPNYGAALVLLITLPALYLAIGPYQADVALNRDLDETARRWWRIVLFLLPWSMALYWHRYVRRERPSRGRADRRGSG
jgi:hypothetical protein